MTQTTRIVIAVTLGIVGLLAVVQLSKNIKQEQTETTETKEEKGIFADIVSGIKGIFS